MAGEFCNKHGEGGRWCTMAAGHSPHPCHFGGRRPRLGASTTALSPSIADYQREKWEQKTGVCSCAAYRAAGVPAACSRCAPATSRESADEKMRAARMAIYNADRRETCVAPTAPGPVVGLDAMLPPPVPAAMLGEALEHIRKARALMTSVGRVGAGRIADVLGEAEDRAEALMRGADTKESKP